MRKGCRLARTLFPLMLCCALVADSSPSAAFSKDRASNSRAGAKGASNLPKSEDVDESLGISDYCMDRATDTREASYNFDPNTLNNRHVRVKRVAMNEGAADRSDYVNKRSLPQFKDKSGYSAESGPEALALSNKELSKYAETIQDSGVNGDYVEKYVDHDYSRMYDDLEARDLVKRGVLLGGEYEEVNEDDEPSDNLLEDTAQAQDNGNADSPSESKAKRDESNWEESKEEHSSDIEPKDSIRVEGGQADLLEKSRDLSENRGYSKRSTAFNDETGLEGDADPKSLKDAKEYEAELRETRGDGDSMSKSARDPTVDLSKVIDVADSSPRREATRLDDPVNSAESSKHNGDLYDDYEKRAEAEIQRKIDAIKEDIKREIEKNQRLREIEENNAKFDELRVEENADDDSEGARVQKRQSVKRTPRHSKTTVRSHDAAKFNKRSVRKKHRKGAKTARRKGGSRKTVVRKGPAGRKSARTRKVSKVSASPVKKREYARQVILVENPGDTRKRKRHSDTVERTAEQSVGASPLTAIEELGKEANENKQRFAPDYNEAFGGLQTDPRTSLVRYKRIKRVLKVPT